jgi:hypothetical protein
MPTVIVAQDVTFSLLQKQLYVPSYNVPYFPFIFNISGYASAGYNYEKDPRGEMYRHYSGNISSLEEMMHFMNSNDYKKDPYSQGSPCNAISARCDLLQKGAWAFGGIDSKVTSLALSRRQEVMAISGPTHQTQPPFNFSPKWESVPHLGMPSLWNFNWTRMTPIIH